LLVLAAADHRAELRGRVGRIPERLVCSAAAWRAIATASSCSARGTSMRVGALQDWPLFLKHSRTPQLHGRAEHSGVEEHDVRRLAAELLVHALDRVGAALATAMPARVEPVKDTMSTPGCADSACPVTPPSPGTRLNTPGRHAGLVQDLGEDDRRQRRESRSA
jgi:hypothetical protein